MPVLTAGRDDPRSNPPPARERELTERGEQTRSAIFAAALALFQERGYEATTMRAIAERAGVSLGSSYHYYPSKSHLVLGFYRHVHERHQVACAPILARERDLTARLRGVIRAAVMTCEPFHDVSASIFSTVADPASSLNPFGEAAMPLRDEVITLYARVVEGADARLPPDLAAELPRLLWLYQMGVLYFWMLDTSAGRLRTLEVVDETSDLIVRLISLANLPPLRRSRQRLLALVRSVAEGAAGG
ncbi:MAG TPA: TetR family transcriptional regulator [Candidatus Dormibacteraeota bacterium]|nr:TetR family transcriptional regulator [Candidatus Dormibacteraeota bacterium]